ncbi:MAG TPA: hypothetical protein VGG56_17920 [Terracidiphilus sp.]|jgi:hypothetical protein
MQQKKSSTRLFVIVARSAPIAVIFRRGPSKQVLLIKWNLEDDTLEIGQWFKARIYERRCDLSPEGEMLLYFAADWRKPYESWSAVSRPPYLSSLALWPKGDGWGGGGQFYTRERILLNHRDGELQLAQEFWVPKWMSIGQFGDRPGWGEDEPVWFARLQRDGWKLVSYPTKTKDEWGAKAMVEFDPPIRWQKSHPQNASGFALQMSIVGIHEVDGPWYLIEHSVVEKNGNATNIGRSDWADWSPAGDLLFTQGGSLFRLRCSHGGLASIESREQIADFSELRFQQCEAPAEARIWPSKRSR